jgi:hypothetical protein
MQWPSGKVNLEGGMGALQTHGSTKWICKSTSRIGDSVAQQTCDSTN